MVILFLQVRFPAQLGEEVQVLTRAEVAIEHDIFRNVGDVLLGLQRVFRHIDAIYDSAAVAGFNEIE